MLLPLIVIFLIAGRFLPLNSYVQIRRIFISTDATETKISGYSLKCKYNQSM